MPLTILVAEDNIINQKVAKLILGKMGFSPTIVANGREAVSEFQKNPYDLILMDDNMPELDGVSAAKEIRSLCKGARPYIAAMTANAIPGDKERYLSSGMDDYLSKPIQKSELEEIINKALSRKAGDTV